MFIRIVRHEKIEGVGYRAGFLDAAYDLVYDHDTPEETYCQLLELINWFKANLQVPTKFTKSSSKAAHLKKTRGLSWFKPSAQEHIGKAFETRVVLESFGIFTDVLRTERAGYIVYEDEFQIVAEPFSDTPT